MGVIQMFRDRNVSRDKVPDLAESVPDATCLAWMKNEGDHITEGENLIDLETDKVTLKS